MAAICSRKRTQTQNKGKYRLCIYLDHLRRLSAQYPNIADQNMNQWTMFVNWYSEFGIKKHPNMTNFNFNIQI
jgi:hypothetical protein